MSFALILAMTATAADPSLAAFEKETAAWHQKRLERLRAEDGWLTLIGLHWLEEGENKAPGDLGTFIRKGRTVAFRPAPAAKVTLNGKPFTGGPVSTDHSEKQDVLRTGTLQLLLIERGDRVGVRVRDSESKARKSFAGIDRYPVSLQWRKKAKVELAPEGRTLPIPNVLGDVTDVPLYGTLIFTHDGAEYRLLATKEGDRLFIVFGDLTNRVDTYGAGRFLYADLPKDGEVTLDFNRATNPPCAFSAFATCPLPVRENKLKLAITAGEKRAGDH